MGRYRTEIGLYGANRVSHPPLWNPKLAKIERISKNGEIQTEEVTTNPYISFFEYSDDALKTEYSFYDEGGNNIE